MINSFSIYQRRTNPNTKPAGFDTINANQEALKSSALKGFLLNKHIKKENKEACDNFDAICSHLLISEQDTPPLTNVSDKKEENFDIKKVLYPILIAGGITLASIGGISVLLKKYSNSIANDKGFVRPDDLARNINIVEEPQFAMYRALRDPSSKNILGLMCVGLMSGVILGAKTILDGAKEVWIKKRDCDINHDLQENLVSVEAEAFSGKLKVVNTLLSDTTKYFKSALTSPNPSEVDFKSYLSFKGNEDKEDKKEEKEKNNKLKNALIFISSALALVAISYGVFRNYQKTMGNLDTFTKKYEDKLIKSRLDEAVQIEDKDRAFQELGDILKSINAKKEEVRKYASQIKGVTDDEVSSFAKEMEKALIYTNADSAVYGTSGKIQYYCYINDDRGHLYNWILNPENKFNKYLFLCFSSISAIGYLAKTAADAVKNVTVSRENSKSELKLRKELVEVEIKNFKAKKLSAINPLIDNFKYQQKQGKSKEELKALAENILIEIKNGPPYVYS